MCPQVPRLSLEYSHNAGLQTVIIEKPLQIGPVTHSAARGLLQWAEFHMGLRVGQGRGTGRPRRRPSTCRVVDEGWNPPVVSPPFVQQDWRRHRAKGSVFAFTPIVMFFIKLGVPPIGADPDANQCVENRRRCSLHKRGWSAFRGRTIRDLAHGSSSLPNKLDGLRLEAGRSTRVKGRWSSPVAYESRSREGPHRGGEVLGLVYGWHATLDTSNRHRAKEKQRIWGLRG
jgi:hypothetical protein